MSVPMPIDMRAMLFSGMNASTTTYMQTSFFTMARLRQNRVAGTRIMGSVVPEFMF
jgi:hypothetical protein